MARRKAGHQRDGAETKPNGGATTGHEAELWAMADALRGLMDAAEYKHVASGNGNGGKVRADISVYSQESAELQAQQAEGARLDAAIAENLKALGFGGDE